MKQLTIILLALVLSTCGDSSSSNATPCKDTDCRDYFSQASAQAAFNADPTCRNDLDQDKDGVACEEPGNEVSKPSGSGSGSTGGGGCPTTNACGCSGKNKTPCQNDPCCKWTTGKGCGCK